MPKTLLHFFSPKSVKKEGENSFSPKSNTSTPLKPKNIILTPKSTEKNLDKKPVISSPIEKVPDFNFCDLVWAKLEGYPWWPSIVCNDPVDGVYHKRETKKDFTHVQFFDDPITHAWVESKVVKIFEGSDSLDFQQGGRFYNADLDVISAAKKADEASKKSQEERKKILVKFEDALEDFADMFDESMEEDEDDSIVSSKNASKTEEGKRPRRKTVKKSAKKRRRIMTGSDDEDAEDSEEDFDPDKQEDEEDSDEYEEEATVSEDPTTESEPDDSLIEDTRKRKRKGSIPVGMKTPSSKLIKNSLNSPAPIAASRTPLVCPQTKSRLSFFQAADHDSSAISESGNSNKYLHETLDFLFPENLKDKHGKKKGDVDYDPSTLKIPESFLKKLTPAMFQWWKMKRDNFDVILFFKIGKFYELYHMDAVVGVNELGLIYMKGAYAHSGFPEIAFGRYSESLVEKGYKVARVEQTETPEQNAVRVKKEVLTKQEKTLRREICRIVTKGTQNLASWHGWSNMQTGHAFLLAVAERRLNGTGQDGNSTNSCREFGVCFVDTSVGLFHLGQFKDDRHCSTLCTMLSHFTPCQILYERGKLSHSFKKILTSGLSTILQEALMPGTQFWDAPKTIKSLTTEEYFVKDGNEEWPQTLKAMMIEEDAITFTAAKNYELALSSLGACIHYLKKCLIDFEVLSMKRFVEYKPAKTEQVRVKMEALEESVSDFAKGDNKMILDSVTLANLEILENNNGGSEGSLIERLDRCQTSFGKRLLRQWLCSPPCNPDVSSDRLDALEDLMGCPELASEIHEILKKMPDLERMLMKIHILSKGSKKAEHPDNRAILYEDDKYSKKKIEDFLAILQNYEIAHQLLKKFQLEISNLKSGLLRKLLGFEGSDIPNGGFPNMEETLGRWRSAFNHKKARETGKIIPNHGANPEYDEALEEIAEVQKELDSYLKQQKKFLSCSVVYKGTGSKRYQLEIAIDVANRSNLSGYVISGQRKGFKSFRTDTTNRLLKEMEAAESCRDAAQGETMAIVFREFDQDFGMWNKAVQCLSILDVLLSLVEYCKSSESEMCRPIFIRQGRDLDPFLEIRTGRHPCITNTFLGDDFIPNDTVLGTPEEEKSPNCLVLTGPNMGGKSTLMRQVGLIVVLAQLGCYVPAEHCKLTPVDRVFTRLGASDRIMAGESTFYVELSETSSILKHATKHSLVLLDELGRGTATYDGTAIALSVVKEISANIQCRTIFSTHYHTVVDDLKGNLDVKQGHMACMVENEDVDDKDPSKETITFLYKLTDGPCPKSYGFHAARLADLPEDVILLARNKAAELENNNKSLTAFRSVFSRDLNENDISNGLVDLIPNGV